MSDVASIIRDAIVNRWQIVATYDRYVREMCPHVMGFKNGRRQVLFFQFAGGSTRGLPPGGQWRCIPIDGLSSVTSRQGEWHTDPRHTKAQTCVDQIEVEVGY
jgi:hypothetical protein